jgi:hypothetical protein
MRIGKFSFAVIVAIGLAGALLSDSGKAGTVGGVQEPVPMPDVVSQWDLDMLPINAKATTVEVGPAVKESDGLGERYRIERTVSVTRTYRFVTLLGSDYTTTFQVPPVGQDASTTYTTGAVE